MLILTTVLISCRTLPEENSTIVEELLLETKVPDPYKADGGSYITLSPEGDGVWMELDYYFDLIEYIIEIEEIKKQINLVEE